MLTTPNVSPPDCLWVMLTEPPRIFLWNTVTYLSLSATPRRLRDLILTPSLSCVSRGEMDRCTRRTVARCAVWPDE